MATLTKREFLGIVGLGAAAFGLESLPGASIARAAELPAWARLPAGATPKSGGKLVGVYQGRVKVLPLQKDFIASCTPSL